MECVWSVCGVCVECVWSVCECVVLHICVGCVCVYCQQWRVFCIKHKACKLFSFSLRTVFRDQKLLISGKVFLSLARDSTFPTGTPESKQLCAIMQLTSSK